MRKLTILASLIILIIGFSCCKDKNVEPAKCDQEAEQNICPIHDAKTIFDSKNTIANLIKEAIADNNISDEEAEKINDAFCEHQSIDAEIKTKYQNNKEAQDELFSILNADNNYNKALKLATEAEGYDKIGSKVR